MTALTVLLQVILKILRLKINIRGISSVGRAIALQAIGRRFEPGILHQIFVDEYADIMITGRVGELSRRRAFQVIAFQQTGSTPTHLHQEYNV